jgi:N-acetylglucosamine kinase-like BadF-type ATPase
MGPADGVVVGLDNGGTANNATVLDAAGRFLVDRLVETPSRVTEGPDVAVAAMAEAFEAVLRITDVNRASVLAVGLDTPGPAIAEERQPAANRESGGKPKRRGRGSAKEETEGLDLFEG